MRVNHLVEGPARVPDSDGGDRPDCPSNDHQPGIYAIDTMEQPADRWSPWGAIGVGAAVSVALHVGVLWLPMQKAQKPAALPLVTQDKPVPVRLVRSAPGGRSTLVSTPKRSIPAQAAQASPGGDRPAPRLTADTRDRRSRPPQSTGPARRRSAATAATPGPRNRPSPTPDRAAAGPASNASPSPDPNPDPSPDPGPDLNPSPTPTPAPQGLPGLAGLDAGEAACPPGQSCYRLPDNFSVHSVTTELLQNSLGSGVQVRELPSIYENTEAAREFEVAKLNGGQSTEIIGYYYVVSTQVQGQVGAIVFGSRDRLLSLDAIQNAAGRK